MLSLISETPTPAITTKVSYNKDKCYLEQSIFFTHFCLQSFDNQITTTGSNGDGGGQSGNHYASGDLLVLGLARFGGVHHRHIVDISYIPKNQFYSFCHQI